jgi:hypothetical protein
MLKTNPIDFSSLANAPGIMDMIIGHLPAHDGALGALPQTSKAFKKSFENPCLWQQLLQKHYPQCRIPAYIHAKCSYRSFYQITSVKAKINMVFDTANHPLPSGLPEESLRILFDEDTTSFLLQIRGIENELRILEQWVSGTHLSEAEFTNAEAYFPVILNTFHALIRILAKTEVRQGDKTFLMLAAHKGYTPLVQALFKAGADPQVQTPTGMRAIQYAALGNHQGTIQCFNERARSPIQSPRDVLHERSPLGRVRSDTYTAATTAGLFMRRVSPSVSPVTSPINSARSMFSTPSSGSSSSSSSSSASNKK